MKSTLITPIIFVFCLFSLTVSAQHIELLSGKTMTLSNQIEYTEKGGVYSVSSWGVNYVSSIETSTPPPVKTSFKRFKYEKVKWVGKDRYIRIIDTKLDGENLEILGAVQELKTHDIVVVKYTVSAELTLIKEEEIVRTPMDKINYPYFEAMSNDSDACTSLFICTKQNLDRKSTKATLKLRIISFNKDLQNIGNNEHHKEVEKFYILRNLYESAILLENGNTIVNINKQLFLCEKGNDTFIPFALELEKTIYTYKFFAGSNDGLILLGGFVEGETVGMATIAINSSGEIIDQSYLPFTNEFSKEFYELSNELNPNSGNKNLKYDDFTTVKPSLIDAKIDDNGIVRAVFMGVVKDQDSWSFRNNFLIIGVNEGKALYQDVIPYIYKEGSYVSVGSTAICVFFDENSTTLCYQDYQQNYDSALDFLPTTEKIPFVNKPLYAAVRYYYDSNKTFHKMLEVKTKPGIDYRKAASYVYITDTVLPDNSILIGCDEWGIATLKESYLGRLIIP